MKFIASIIKSFKENIRDWKVLIIVLVFSPFFLIIMYASYGGEATSYNMSIVDYDRGMQSQELIKSFKELKSLDDSKLFNIKIISDEEQLKVDVKEKMTDIGIVIPNGYSEELVDEISSDTLVVQFFGSLSNTKYTVAVIFAADTVYRYGMTVQEVTLPSYFNETLLETRMPLNEFEAMVPGLMALAVLMIMFTCSASIVKENDKLTIMRLKLSALGSVNYLGGVSVVQAIIATTAILLSYATALMLGYESSGDFVALLVVGILSSVAMVAVSLVIASFLNTVFDVLTIGCIPFFVIMFFSGGMFPLPKINVVTIAGRGLGFGDLIPLTHTTNAFNKILNYDSGLMDVMFDIVMILILTVVYMCIGVVLYKYRRLSKA